MDAILDHILADGLCRHLDAERFFHLVERRVLVVHRRQLLGLIRYRARSSSDTISLAAESSTSALFLRVDRMDLGTCHFPFVLVSVSEFEKLRRVVVRSWYPFPLWDFPVLSFYHPSVVVGLIGPQQCHVPGLQLDRSGPHRNCESPTVTCHWRLCRSFRSRCQDQPGVSFRLIWLDPSRRACSNLVTSFSGILIRTFPRQISSCTWMSILVISVCVVSIAAVKRRGIPTLRARDHSLVWHSHRY